MELELKVLDSIFKLNYKKTLSKFDCLNNSQRNEFLCQQSCMISSSPNRARNNATLIRGIVDKTQMFTTIT